MEGPWNLCRTEAGMASRSGKKWLSRSEPDVIKIVMGWLSMSNTNTSYLIGGVKEFTTANIHSIQFQLLPHVCYVTYFMDQSSKTWSPTDRKRFCTGLKWTVFDNDPMNQTEPTSNFRTKGNNTCPSNRMRHDLELHKTWPILLDRSLRYFSAEGSPCWLGQQSFDIQINTDGYIKKKKNTD